MQKHSTIASRMAIVITGVAIIAGVLGCQTKTETKVVKKLPPPTNLILATTTSTADTGLLDYLLPIFEKKYNVKVKPVAVGSGEAIAMGQRGEADVLLVHSRKDEDKFMADGYGSLRHDVMYNDFILIGPKSDPAAIKGQKPAPAFQGIANKLSPFVSRGDNSGTYKKELALWAAAGIKPAGDWYIITGQGMGESLKIANEKQAYILSDRGTYLATKKSLSLVILVEKDPLLLNPYGVIVGSKAKFDKVNDVDARAFAKWIVSPEVQKLIGDFGKKKYGQALFVPGVPVGATKQ